MTSSRPIILSRRRSYIIVTLIFIVLAACLQGLTWLYWNRVLEPRLLRESRSQADVLAHSQSTRLADALMGDQGVPDETGLNQVVDEILLFSDSQSGKPLFLGLRLEMDYDVVPVPAGSLDQSHGLAECGSCFESEAALFSPQSDELMGIARFLVSDRLYQQLSRDVRWTLFAQSSLAILLLALVWAALMVLIRQLNRSRMAAEAATNAKSVFLANMSHEIRTPMNAVMGLTHLALQTPLTPQQQDYLEKIDKSSSSLLRLLNDILDFSKIEAGRMDLEEAPFALRDVAENLNSAIGFLCAEKGLAYHMEVAESLPEQVVGDALRFEQVLMNLAYNAVKFTTKGQVSILLECDEATGDGISLRCSVRDTGIGMSRELIDELFQPYRQADASITRTFGGTGLGLAISRSLVGMMGGEIAVESEPGKGSAFTFTVAFAKAREEDAHAHVPPLSLQLAKELLAGRRVLIVEDNKINLQVASELLTQVDLVVDTAPNGKEAVDMALAQRYDAVLMDMQMPVMDGLAATRAIRRHLSADDLPILAMTANAMAADRRKCRIVGMNGHIPKPIIPHVLYETLAHWIAADRLGSERDFRSGETPETEPALPMVDGVDTRAGMFNVNNDKALYLKVLHRVAREHHGAPEQLASLLRQGDLQAAEHLAHSLKGMAGTVGAEELRRHAGELETVLRDRAPDAGDALLEAFTREWDKAMTGIQTLLDRDDADQTLSSQPSPGAGAGASASPNGEKPVRSIVEELAALVEQGDAAAQDKAAELEHAAGTGPLAPEVRLLRASLDEYEFDDAQKGLVRILHLLESGE